MELVFGLEGEKGERRKAAVCRRNGAALSCTQQIIGFAGSLWASEVGGAAHSWAGSGPVYGSQLPEQDQREHAGPDGGAESAGSCSTRAGDVAERSCIRGCSKEPGVNLTPPGRRRLRPEQELIEEHVCFSCLRFHFCSASHGKVTVCLYYSNF